MKRYVSKKIISSNSINKVGELEELIELIGNFCEPEWFEGVGSSNNCVFLNAIIQFKIKILQNTILNILDVIKKYPGYCIEKNQFMNIYLKMPSTVKNMVQNFKNIEDLIQLEKLVRDTYLIAIGRHKSVI